MFKMNLQLFVFMTLSVFLVITGKYAHILQKKSALIVLYYNEKKTKPTISFSFYCKSFW